MVGAGVVRHKNANEVINLIARLGIPLLVACDVKEPPAFVKLIARRFNVKVFSPSKNLTQESKKIITKYIFDHHIRDAYAAAVKAYRKYANRFHRLDCIYPEKAEEYKRFILEGKAVGKIANVR